MAPHESIIGAVSNATQIRANSDVSAVTAADTTQLLLLALLWGASFLFMRVAAPEFGPVSLVALRVAIAALVLAPFLRLPNWRSSAPRVAWLGVVNSAAPFCLFAYAAVHLPAGFSAILNATAVLWAAAIGWALFGAPLDGRGLGGALVGVAGVIVMVSHRLVWPEAAGDGTGPAVAAAVAATVCYGYAVHYSRRHMTGIPSRSVAAGSQLAAALVLAAPGVALWPPVPPSLMATVCVLGLGTLSTAWAYLLYFRLIERIGAARAMTVTVLVPAFGVALGAIVLGEALTMATVIGGALVLVGCSLALGGRPR
jgi:drug/metabolite transporter (DMT)-like permease